MSFIACFTYDDIPKAYSCWQITKPIVPQWPDVAGRERWAFPQPLRDRQRLHRG